MPESDYKPRGGSLLFVFKLLALTTPVMAIYALSYFEAIQLSMNFTDHLFQQIGWNTVIALHLSIVVFFVAKGITAKMYAGKQSKSSRIR